jgi:hypothetical protein
MTIIAILVAILQYGAVAALVLSSVVVSMVAVGRRAQRREQKAEAFTGHPFLIRAAADGKPALYRSSWV